VGSALHHSASHEVFVACVRQYNHNLGRRPRTVSLVCSSCIIAVLYGPSIFNRPFEPMETAGEVSQNVSHMPHFVSVIVI
jgi:hypothetical protein